MKTRILTQRHVRELLTMDIAVPAVERAFAAHGRGETIMPVKVYLPLETYRGDFRAMPAYMEGSAGVKWVNSHPENPRRFGLPAVMGMYILSDPATAAPLAVMDATLLTAVRTGASAAVATQHLGPPAPKTIGFIGCGVQARTLLEALRTVHAGLELLMADADRAAAEKFADEVGGRAVELREAAGCDIVCTATPVREPIVEPNWVAPGAHINAMGADAPGKQELDGEILKSAKVVVDDRAQAHESGEINVPMRRGDLLDADIYATLGEIVSGLKPGREASETTVFDSTGLAIQDVALARAVYDAACAANVGEEVTFIEAHSAG